MRKGINNIDHYLDDFIFMSIFKDQCKLILDEFSCLCQELAVPVPEERTVGPVTCITYLGYELDSELMEIRIPQDKIVDILQQIEFILSKSKVSLRQLQSLTGSLAFCTKAMPSARTFVRRIYSAMSHATRTIQLGLQKAFKKTLRCGGCFSLNITVFLLC